MKLCRAAAAKLLILLEKREKKKNTKESTLPVKETYCNTKKGAFTLGVFLRTLVLLTLS
jgi:hypothetical protein